MWCCRWADRVLCEFFAQGDQERAAGLAIRCGILLPLLLLPTLLQLLQLLLLLLLLLMAWAPAAAGSLLLCQPAVCQPAAATVPPASSPPPCQRTAPHLQPHV